MPDQWQVEFEAPTKPWSVNERVHWAERGRRVKAWRTFTAAAAQKQIGKELPPCVVHVDLPFSRGGRRDPHNYFSTCVKSVVDGLGPMLVSKNKKGEPVISAGAGLWPDDTPEYVTTVEPTLSVRKDGLVVVTLTER